MEKFLQYVWQNRLWMPLSLSTTDGLPVKVLDPGWLNKDAGPDFFNAKIIIGEQEWVGNIEVHVKASDWYRHSHQFDRLYDSVILHVVSEDDATVTRLNGLPVPQVVVKCTEQTAEMYDKLEKAGELDLICASTIPNIPSIYLTDWVDSLGFERIYEKVERFQRHLANFYNDWEQALYVTLARALGFGHNGEMLERVAKSLPLNILGKHRDNLLSLEAMFLGQAALLPDVSPEPYVQQMIDEYKFMAVKFSLRQPEGIAWQMGRMRPQNLPYRRLAVLAALINREPRLFSRIMDCRSMEDLREIFRFDLTGYWATASSVYSHTGLSPLSLSDSSIDVIIINVVAPLFYAYGEYTGSREYTERAVDLLNLLSPEHNSIVSMFTRAGIKCSSAFHSQALIRLRRSYCEQRKCLYCRIGHLMMKATTKNNKS
ncbi:MAG: DUF2851 family protein [Muribaculaceae bacterium]